MDPIKIISIDPSWNGVTGLLIAEYDPMAQIMDLEDPLTITNFANIDFRFLSEKDNVDQAKYRLAEKRHRKLKELLMFVIDEQPDLVIVENFIMFKQQMGTFGQSFITSEMIGIIEYHCREHDIPVFKPRSSDVYQKRTAADYYYYPQEDGTTLKVGKPKKFKENLHNKQLINRGLLKRGRYNAISMIVNGQEFKLKDYQVGAKNDHILMALRHLVNTVEHPTKGVEQIINEIKQYWDEEYKI